MALVHRKVTPKLLAANRANAQKSTGPRTEQGIINTSQNIMKSLPFSPTFMANMGELGENPEEYEAVRQALHRAFGPQDDFEVMLIEDMAQARWRRQRLIRAESGLAASQRRKLEIERELKKHGRGGGWDRVMKLRPVVEFGYAGMDDSVEKCEHMLDILGLILEGVRTGPLSEKEMVLFRAAYGEGGEPGGPNLKARYEDYAKFAKTADPEAAEELRKEFVAEVKKEIAAYEKLKELLAARDVETTAAMKDAQLLPDADQLEAIARYDAGLERQFENKLKVLVAWRSAKRAAPAARISEAGALPAKGGKTG
jgi:hypothetical protein